MFPVLIAVLLFALVIFTVWNLISSRRHLRNSPPSSTGLDDSKYYELKYKQEFLVAAFVLIAGVAAFLGINTKDSLEKNLTEEIETKLKTPKNSIDSVSRTVASVDTLVRGLEAKTNELQARIEASEQIQSEFNTKSHQYSAAMAEILTRIKQINEKNILKQDVYVVTGLNYDARSGGLVNGYKQYLFKDMKTILGDKLPTFKKAPFILAVSRQGGLMNLDNITTESFYLNVWNQVLMNNDNYKWTKSDFDLLISEIPD